MSLSSVEIFQQFCRRVGEQGDIVANRDNGRAEIDATAWPT